MADLERKAKEAFIDDHFVLAVDLYTQAIALNPTNPALFVHHASAPLNRVFGIQSTADLERKAKDAFIDDHFVLAIDLYTQAIALNPTNPDLFADRAQASIKLNNLTGILS